MGTNKRCSSREVAIFWCMVFLHSSMSLAAGTAEPLVADAAKKGDIDAVQSLLKQHTDVNVPQADGTTAIDWAVYRDDLEMTNLLIRAGANVNAVSDYGVTPLSLACTNRNPAMIDSLLKAGANPNAAQSTGVTALMTCARTGNIDAVKLILAREPHVNAKETQLGQTALLWAVAEKHPDVVRALIEHGADIQIRTKNGFTPLLFAAQQGDIESARILLEAGANVNEAMPDGMTPLLVASGRGHESLSIFLLEKGANPNAATNEGMTALHYAVVRGLTLIQDVRFDPVISYLFRPNMPELVKELLKRGANPNVRLTKKVVGATPYLAAAASYDVTLMRALVASGADPRAATKAKLTALMAAAGMGRREDRTEEEERDALQAVKVAFELGSDLNATNDIGQTAVHAAAYTGSDAIIEFLAEKGGNLDAKDKYGQTALSIAEVVITPELVDFGVRPFIVHKSTADLLLKLGATPLAASASTPAQHGSAGRSQ